MQSELRELAQKKDSLNVELGNFSVSLSKASMSREFLQQQIGKTEQELLQVNLDVQKMSSDSTDSFVQNLVTQEGEIQKQIDNLQQKIEQVEQRLQSYYDRENQWKNSIADEDKKFRELQQRAGQIRDRQSALEVDKAKIDVQLETIWTEINQSLGQSLADEIMKNPLPLSQSQTEDKIVKLKHQLELIGGVDELTLQEYHETEGRYANLTNQVNDLKKSMDDLRAIMDELDEHIKTKFNEAFHKINGQFENYFRVLFNGGRAYLSLVKAGEERIVEEEQEEEQEDDGSGQLRPEEKLVARYEKGSFNIIGVDIKATPPGKKLSTIQALSGGERALTSIALLCSLLACFPSPFVVLDEVDAALDEANTIRFGQILGTLAHQTQFITITHNRETMAQSNTLYGVTMGDDGISKLLSIKLEQARVYAK
jgi:chromosome segregation protein